MRISRITAVIGVASVAVLGGFGLMRAKRSRGSDAAVAEPPPAPDTATDSPPTRRSRRDSQSATVGAVRR